MRAAASNGASSKTMFADLPPSSSESPFVFEAAARITARPAVVDPVKAILSTASDAARCWPTKAPRSMSEVSTLNAPSGRPASCRNWASRIVGEAQKCDGLITAVQPAASAGATFATTAASGKFHAVIIAATPTGSRRINPRESGLRLLIADPSSESTAPA